MDNARDLYNAHKNETCIIACNGPSLKDVPLDMLNDHITFGLNKCHLLKGFRPTYFVCVNPLVLAQLPSEVYQQTYWKFTTRLLNDSHAWTLRSMRTPMFSYSPLDYVYEGHTVTFVALQLAFYMGFSRVIMVGLDHKYEFAGMPNEQQLLVGDDPNHFHPDYFNNCLWHTPDLTKSEEAYGMALRAFVDVGRTIVNATPGTALTVFPCMERPWVA